MNRTIKLLFVLAAFAFAANTVFGETQESTANVVESYKTLEVAINNS